MRRNLYSKHTRYVFILQVLLILLIFQKSLFFFFLIVFFPAFSANFLWLTSCVALKNCSFYLIYFLLHIQNIVFIWKYNKGLLFHVCTEIKKLHLTSNWTHISFAMGHQAQGLDLLALQYLPLQKHRLTEHFIHVLTLKCCWNF